MAKNVVFRTKFEAYPAKSGAFGHTKFLKIVKKLFPKSFLTGVWGSAPNI